MAFRITNTTDPILNTVEDAVFRVVDPVRNYLQPVSPTKSRHEREADQPAAHENQAERARLEDVVRNHYGEAVLADMRSAPYGVEFGVGYDDALRDRVGRIEREQGRPEFGSLTEASPAPAPQSPQANTPTPGTLG